MARQNPEARPNHHVVIVGGGFAGIECAKALGTLGRTQDISVTLIDRRNFHCFQPLLYQVATGGLSPGDIAAPLRSIVKPFPNVQVVQGEVTGLDVAQQTVMMGEEHLEYDTLVLCTGARHSYFGHDEWELVAPGLKTVEDATEIRARVLSAFERAEREADPALRQALLTFVVVGGGPTGVELAGALGELSRFTMKGEYRSIKSEQAQILLLEGGPRILSMYAERLSTYAVGALADVGVEVRTRATVTGIDADGVSVTDANGQRRIPARTVLWAAGVQASPLAQAVAQQTQAVCDRAGRVVVDAQLNVPGHPDLFVLGDMASASPKAGQAPLPGLSPVAMQMGRYAAATIGARLRGHAVRPFSYLDKGTMAVIGRSEAVARLGGVGWGMTGFIAWLAWLVIHLLFLVGFENRLLVLIQWANHYLTRNRGARLIANSSERFGPK
jgi:NADH dehydrogenase